MKTALMGYGDIIVSCIIPKGKKSIGIMISKSKKRLELKPLDSYEKEPIQNECIGKRLFLFYFINKESLKRFIDNLQNIYDRWE